MENPYGHDRWCNLMTAHSGAGGRRRRKGVGEATGGVDRRRGDGQEGWVMGCGGGRRGWWMIFCPQDWPAGVDLYSIKSDNQLSVKGIVLSCAAESKNSGSDSSWSGNAECFINHLQCREFVTDIFFFSFSFVLLLTSQNGLMKVMGGDEVMLNTQKIHVKR